MKPIPRLKMLDEYVGEWVAVKEGAVVAHAESSVALAAEMQHVEADDAVVQYAFPPSASWRVGVVGEILKRRAPESPKEATP